MLRYVHISNKHFKDINPLDCGEEFCDPNFSRGPIIFSYYLLHYVYDGSGTFNTDGTDYDISNGMISIIHPNETNHYYTNKDNPWHYSWIGFETSLKLPILDDNHVLVLPQAEHIFLDLKNSNNITHGRQHYMCSKIHELLVLLEQTYNTNNTNNVVYDAVSKAKNHIDINYTMPISFEDLAASLNLSRNYFGYIFKKLEKCTPYQYLTNVRLTKSIDLITIHNYSIGDAALAVGYTDIFTFSKAFKRKYGRSPSEYLHA